MKRKVIVLLCISFLIVNLAGCYDRREIDDMSFAVAIGLDKGETNILKMTLQLAVPSSAGGGDSGGGGGGSESSTNVTVETPTIYAGLNMLNNFVTKQINVSHAKLIVFSEEMAREGIEKYIHALVRGREFRPSMYIAVAKGSAENYIKNITPAMELNAAKYYELMYNSYHYTGFTANTQFHNFYTQSESTYRQPVATLAGVSKFQTSEDFETNNSTYKEKGRSLPLEGDFEAGDVTRTGKVKSEIMGLAVFNNDRMVGELDGEETMYYLMSSGEYDHSNTSIPDPKDQSKFVLLNLKQSRKPVYTVKMVNGKPNIDLKIKLEADFLSIQSDYNYEDVKNTPIVENATEEFLKNGILKFLDKTAKEFESDICGFGKVVKSRKLTWDDWMKVHWLEKYKESNFNVSVDVKIRRPGLIIRSVPSNIENSEEGSIK